MSLMCVDSPLHGGIFVLRFLLQSTQINIELNLRSNMKYTGNLINYRLV
jgi:hypothetical protein